MKAVPQINRDTPRVTNSLSAASPDNSKEHLDKALQALFSCQCTLELLQIDQRLVTPEIVTATINKAQRTINDVLGREHPICYTAHSIHEGKPS